MVARALLILATRHLTERPIRTGITIVGITLGVAVSIAIRSANVEVLRSFEDAVTSVAGQATLQVTAGDLGLDERLIVIVREHPQVQSAQPVLSIGATVASDAQADRSLRILGLDLLEAGRLRDFEVETARPERWGDERLFQADAIFVGTRLARDWGLTVGDPLDLYVGTTRHQLVVAGLLAPTTDRAGAWAHLAVMDIAAAQETFALVGRLDRIDVVTEPEAAVDQVARDLRDRLSGGVAVQRPSQRNRQVERMVKAFQLNLTTLSAVGLLVGLLLVYNTVAYAVVQRRREIGIIRALGLARGGVLALFVCEGALMGVAGGALGAWLGLTYATRIVAQLKRNVSDLYVQVPPGGGGWHSGFDGVLLEGALLGMVVSILGAFGPSLEASRTQPARALAPGQYEEAQELRAGWWAALGGMVLLVALASAWPGPVRGLPLFGYLSALGLLVGLSLMAPLVLRRLGGSARSRRRDVAGVGRAALPRLAADQVARTPGRNAVTVSALMVGVAIMVGVGIMIQSFRQTVEDWIEQTIMADVILAPASWPTGDEGAGQGSRIPPSVAELVETVPGVAAVDPYRVMRLELEGRMVSLVARDLAVHATWGRYLFAAGDSSVLIARALARDGVLVSEVFARTFSLGTGDRVVLPTPRGDRAFTIEGVFFDYATDGGKVVMDRKVFGELWRDRSATVIPVYLEPGVTLEEARGSITEAVGRQGELALISNAAIKQEILAIFDRTFAVTYALEVIAVTIALLGIANTVLTSVLERQRELATMRAVGASTAQIRGLVLWETSYLGVIGGVMGVLAGLLLSILLIDVINRQSFGWTIRFLFTPGLIVEALAVAVAAALIAGYLPAAWAARQPIAEGLRYE